MAFGFSGLQFAYIGRWWLFALQFLIFTAMGLVSLFSDQIATCISRFCEDSACLSLFSNPQNALWLCCGVAVNMIVALICMFIIKRDGHGGKLKEDYNLGWFLALFILFGFTGAHLAYTKERLLLGVHLILITPLVVTFMLAGNYDVLMGAVVLSILEAIVAIGINLFFGTSFLDKDK